MAASKKVAGFRAWLNIPFHYFKVSLVVWKLKGSNSPHLWGYPDISTLDLISCHFVAAKVHVPGISHAEELAERPAEWAWAACSQPHSWCQWCWAGRGSCLPTCCHGRSHLGGLPYSFCASFFLKPVPCLSTELESIQATTLRCRLGFSNLLEK